MGDELENADIEAWKSALLGKRIVGIDFMDDSPWRLTLEDGSTVSFNCNLAGEFWAEYDQESSDEAGGDG